MSKPTRARIVLRSAGETTLQGVIVDYGETWTYLEGANGHDPGFEEPGYSEAGWSSGAAAFGYVLTGEQTLGPNAPPCLMNTDLVNTNWTVGTDLTLRKTITIPAGTTALYFELGVDNEAIIYLDGLEVGRMSGTGCSTRGSLNFWVTNPTAGSTVLAVRAIDHGLTEDASILKETFFDMKVVAVGADLVPSGGAATDVSTGIVPTAGQSGTLPLSGCGVFTPSNPTYATDVTGDSTYSVICNSVTWSAGLRTGYWVVDLGSAKDVAKSIVKCSAVTSFGTGNGALKVYYSTVGTSGPWTLAANHGQFTGSAAHEEVFTAISARYWKLAWEYNAPASLLFYNGINLSMWQLWADPPELAVTEKFTPFVDRGPGDQVALLTDAKKIGVSQYHNSAGELFFTLPNLHPQIAGIIPWKTHYSLELYRGEGWFEVASGWIRDYDSTDEETVFYGVDYLGVLSLLYDERFNPDQSPDAAALIYPNDAAGLGGSKYTDTRIDTIIGDQIDRAINSPSSPLGFMQRGQIDALPETLTIYSMFKERLAFISGLIDSHRAGTGLRTQVMVNRYTTWVDAFTPEYTYKIEVFDNPGEDREDLRLEYGGLIQGYRVVPFGDFGTRVLGIGKTSMGFRLEYDVEGVPPPAGEASDYFEQQYGRLSKLNYWEDIVDLNDLKRRVRQYATRVGAIGKQVGLGLRTDRLGIKDGWNIGDSVPVVIQRGPVDTTTMGNGLWTIWGWAAMIEDDGHTDLVLTLLPKDPTDLEPTSAADSATLTVDPAPDAGYTVHTTDPDLTVSPGTQGTWINSATGHIFKVDPVTGMWYDATDAGDMAALPALPTGPRVMIIEGEPGEDGLPGIRGRDGVIGVDGAAGAQGPAGFGLDGADGEDALPIPGPVGPQGNPGTAGVAGPSGPIGFGLDGSDGEDAMMVPGPVGPTGATGAAGATDPALRLYSYFTFR